jgi:bifunctional pyridoxal-dependent enzyme with beta-cystathionase and maltose regulon repressor activities
MNGSPSLRNRINTVVRDIPRSGIRDFFDIVTTMKDVISLGIGEPDFDTPWHVREATVHAIERGATHYSSNLGYIELRRALAKYVAQNFGAEYNPDNEVLVTVGVSEALDLALRRIDQSRRRSAISRAVLRVVSRDDLCSRAELHSPLRRKLRMVFVSPVRCSKRNALPRRKS